MLNPGIQDFDKVVLSTSNIVFYLYQSNLEINRAYLTTKYSSVFSNNVMILPIALYERKLALYNCDILHEGGFLYSIYHFSLDIENTTFDLYKSQGGITLNFTCPFPFLNPKTLLRLETVKFYFSQGKNFIIIFE